MAERIGSHTTPQLTEREYQVLALVAEGLSSKQIGASLGLSHNTINVVRSRINKKVVGPRPELVEEARRRGVLPLVPISDLDAIGLACRVAHIRDSSHASKEDQARIAKTDSIAPVMYKRMGSDRAHERAAAISFVAYNLEGIYRKLSQEAGDLYPIILDSIWDEETNQAKPELRPLPQLFGQIAMMANSIANRLGQVGIDYEMAFKHPENNIDRP